ncbi:protein adenylyltransferase SelO [Picosynechococcus sp. PCC 73109]|uniref:protein adenylyltransferase SelO n=1 Tax=Picosynechococcus sp. PCC 73109 TaxID=374982 RepID=UPI0009F951CC
MAPISELTQNPLVCLPYEQVFASLGDRFSDEVTAADFPHHELRFRNDAVLEKLGLEPKQVDDQDFLEAFGQFQAPHPLRAMCYHGYQFGQYNPQLGDGRGFLYGQVRAQDGLLYDLGTKGSGQTPYSRNGDGRLTLKGGVREVLAAEALHQLGVNTSRCLSLIETGESLWRGDEPSPTRSSVMVRFQRSHIRFGTFERLYYLQRRDLLQQLLDHVVEHYYDEYAEDEDAYALFYADLVKRVARLEAQWMAAGFCHGVLNTDNMAITGESFDYGPYAFIPSYDRKFTAAYFDYSGRYSYGNQPMICRLNLEMLQMPLALVMDKRDLATGLVNYEIEYEQTYRQLMLEKLGLRDLPEDLGADLFAATLALLEETQTGYHDFFYQLRVQFNHAWRSHSSTILENSDLSGPLFEQWQGLYQRALQEIPEPELAQIGDRLISQNPKTALLRPVIESVWEPITTENNWQPFYDLLTTIQQRQ